MGSNIRCVAFLGNVNPGLINLKRLFNWEGTIEVLDEMTIGGVPPLINKTHGLLIRG